MKQFVYPAVLYLDKEYNSYAVALYDINVFTEGETVEDAFLKAKSFLCSYCECALKVNGFVDDATSYLDTVKKHKNDIVLLIDAQVDDQTVSLEAQPDDLMEFEFDSIDKNFKLSDV
jgi:predicted RNase H-like HicB family nuclease